MIAEGDRKRAYHSQYEVKAPSAVEMEAYHLTRLHSADPMAAFVAKADGEDTGEEKGKRRRKK